jgi:3-hydroxyisobutyrate dehydrogenase-like beta-hydroxyacid dehydrogenase
MPTIGLIGLGNAGRPIGERILARGYTLTVYDLNPAAVKGLVRLGARGVGSAKEAVSDITLAVLPSSVEVRQAVFGAAGGFETIHPGMTFIDLSGTDPDCARELQTNLKEKGAAFLGGTIHAGGAPAIVIPQGQFTIAVGGTREIIDGCIGFLKELAQTVICLPEPWMPKAFKIAVIMYSTANNIATAEICSWLTAQGADPKLFLKLLRATGSQGSAARLEEFMKRDNNNGGALSNSYKDVRQALEVAAALQIPMPLLSMASQIQEMGRAIGLTRLNSPAAMGKLYELIAGTDLSAATMDIDKQLPESREPRVVYLGD